MPVTDEKITSDSVPEQNVELAELLTGKWGNRTVVTIARDTRPDGEYWVLIYST